MPVIKRSPGKGTYPGCKQVWRVFNDSGAIEDVLALTDAPPPAGAQPLLREVMRKGVRMSRPPLTEVRERCRQEVAKLPREVRRLIDGRKYPVRIRIDS